MNKKRIFLIFVILITAVYFMTGLGEEEPAEELEVVVGFGADLSSKNNSTITYMAPSSIYNFEDNGKISSSVKTGYGDTPAKTRQYRQRITNKQYVLGEEEVYVLSKSIAENALNDALEIFFRNPYTNDSADVVISAIKPEEVFKTKVPGYISSADYIHGIVKNLKYYGFFSNDYKMSKLFLSSETEGRSVILPYLNMQNGQFIIDGLCIFKKNKLAGIVNMPDCQKLNMLSGTNGRGIVSIIKPPSMYVDYYSKVNRKVKVYRDKYRYKYEITLNFIGDIISNNMYDKAMDDVSESNKIKRQLEETIQKSCMEFVKRLQREYKTDALGLGEFAAAKYGRNTGTNWDDVFSKADVEVKVNVKIDKYGRGQYKESY